MSATPVRRVRRSQRALIALAILALLLGTGGWLAYHWFNPGYVSRPALGPGPIFGTVEVSRVPTMEEQRGKCASQPETAHLLRLTKPLTFTVVVFCRPAFGTPDIELTSKPATATLLAALSSALSHNDVRNPAGACPAVLPIVRPFAVVVGDQTLRLAMPVNDCGGPQKDALDALSALAVLAAVPPAF
jgi:hypothetical protein